jgi:DNA-binding NarL/FixJ family response regulator
MRNTNKPPYAATEIPKKQPTVKQLQVLILRSRGLTQEKIAEQLSVSRSTVKQRIRALRERGINVP